MKVDELVVSKNLPDWLKGGVFVMRQVSQDPLSFETSYGPPKMVAFSSSKPRLVYPRWYHKLGRKLGLHPKWL